MKINLKLENPKQFLPLLLFFGFVLVLIGNGVETLTANPALTNDGWAMVAIAVLLWILKEAKEK